jgi:signal peptidase II
MIWKQKLVFWSTCFFLIAFDRASKLLALHFLREREAWEFIPGFLEFRYAENTGIAFSFFSGNPLKLTLLISLIVLAVLIYLLINSKFNLAWAFIFSGALGNLIDRFIHGYVIDFINPLFIDFAIFNLADSFLNIGMLLMLLEWRSSRKAL